MSNNNSIIQYEQFELDLRVITTTEVDGLEMGVLLDGTPFLTGRGLAKICGIAFSTLFEWGEKAPEQGDRLRAGKMAELLTGHEFKGTRLFVKVVYKDQLVNAYPDQVCMAFLEYYAFEAGRYCTESSKYYYRKLANKTLKDFIYKATGYDPLAIQLGSWKHFHDRLLLNPLPTGYFSVFKETSDIVVAAISEGLIVDEHTVPDISVGKLWSEFWKKRNLEADFGARFQFPHVYPDYFPQAQANGSINQYVYPLVALGEFRIWLQTEYLPKKFPEYLKRKVKQGALPASHTSRLLKALNPVHHQLIELT